MGIDLDIFEMQDKIIRMQSKAIKELCYLLLMENSTPESVEMINLELEKYRAKTGGDAID